MTLDTRWEDITELLKRSERTQDEKLQAAVTEIAAQRFEFPSPEYPSFRTYVNSPEIAMAVQVGGEEIVPTIVVVEKIKEGDSRLVMTAQVCVPEEVNDGEAKRLWSRIASVPDQAFYLYVPVGFGLQAKQICKRLKVTVEGFRTWRTTPRGFEINDVG
jgi:hypothetical protein